MLVWWNYSRKARIGNWRKFFLCLYLIVVRWWRHGKLAVLDLSESGRQIGEKLLVLLTVDQKKELARFVLKGKTGGVHSTDIPCYPFFHGKYFVSKQTSQPLTEIREGEIYYCLEQRIVTIREQIIELIVKEFEIFSLLIMNFKWVHLWNAYGFEMKITVTIPGKPFTAISETSDRR